MVGMNCLVGDEDANNHVGLRVNKPGRLAECLSTV